MLWKDAAEIPLAEALGVAKPKAKPKRNGFSVTKKRK